MNDYKNKGLIKPKRLFQVNVSVNWGSHGRIAEEIGMFAMSKGWESFIAYGRYANPSSSHLIKIGNEWDVRMHGLATRLFDSHGLGSAKATRLLVKAIESLKPDIIHLHNIHGYYLNYTILFDFLCHYGRPVVWTLHDCWPVTGHCAYPELAKCEKWQICCNNCPLIKEYPSSFIDRSERNFNLKKNSFTSLPQLHIVTVSKWLEILVCNSFLKNCDIKNIYNGLDLNVFYPIKTKWNDVRNSLGLTDSQKIVLGVASVWEERKGLEDFYKLRKILNNDYLILLVGLDEKQRKTLPSGIIGIGRTNNIQQLVEIYSIADVFVNPSIAETFGMTTAEALACGTPAIVYNATASPELVDSNTGAVVPVGDIKQLGENVIRFCELENKLTISKACRKRAECMFNKQERYQEYIDLYQKILKL